MDIFMCVFVLVWCGGADFVEVPVMSHGYFLIYELARTQNDSHI